MNNTLVVMVECFYDSWQKNKFLTVSWLSGHLSPEIFISTGEFGDPDATTDQGKQSISAVRVSGGLPGNVPIFFRFSDFVIFAILLLHSASEATLKNLGK